MNWGRFFHRATHLVAQAAPVAAVIAPLIPGVGLAAAPAILAVGKLADAADKGTVTVGQVMSTAQTIKNADAGSPP